MGRGAGYLSGPTGQNVRHGLFISRADVADCMLRVLDEPETFGQTVGIAN